MPTTRPRLALFTLEALPNARAVRGFVADHASDIAFVGVSNAERPSTGGLIGQVRRHLARSGPAILPYLAVNFGLPDLLRPLAPLTQGFTGSSDTSEATPLAPLCRRLGIPTATIDDVNGSAMAETLRACEPDLIVSFHFDQIFSGETLALARLGGLNVHPSLLPRHRGPVPTIHAVAEGKGAFGVSVHRLVPKIDAGSLLAQEAVTLPPDVTATRAAMQLHERGRILLDGVLGQIAEEGRVSDGIRLPLEPYCGFPDKKMLRAMRSQGRKLTDSRDLSEALTLSAKASPVD
ncbi:formyltransferase family protein [Methylobacterium gnaphalii]|uniref:Formyl transferase N-terminal domain-containing protein n=1 Tax=Methylobacterium gnaphalii TaxID=1010610 RepID=A0A512JRT5_9HYPH|nr:formyltransferase family protein [Methylobacterium gnaphalii]GEP12676.1 hypothetical protein MGN01_45210 [Methylobacterium gnaphalii]GJD70858.1 Methionyl-tRNA formyltransferase [Methylobacterium gnaphalii]GLS51699.1 hypothetical protein GCM10007885_45600 [Methylobacterium gnaphalii]